VYRVTGPLTSLGIAQVHAKSTRCGSVLLDLRFKDLLPKLLANHPLADDTQSMEHFVRTFREREKLVFPGDDGYKFQFECYDSNIADDPEFGIRNGKLEIPGVVLQSYIFDPVISKVLDLLEIQYSKVPKGVDALFLVGGFSNNEYLFGHIEQRFCSRIPIIIRPPDVDTAICCGALRYGLTQHSLISYIISPKAYIFKVDIQAEMEDRIRRPAYVDAVTWLCKNRLKYLVSKGALVQRDQRFSFLFNKRSTSPEDNKFVLFIHSSESYRVLRYADEGTHELCRWAVDLSPLPSFQQRARDWENGNSFVTEFELAFEIDATEMRGYLMDNDEIVGMEVFDRFS